MLTELTCYTGYHLTFPADQSPLMSCPFLLHTRMPLSWTISTNTNQLFLHSTDCSGTSKISTKGKEVLPQPCTFCVNLNNHNIIMGICHQALDGTHESTPWQYLFTAQMYLSFKRKDEFINVLKLRSLTAGN